MRHAKWLKPNSEGVRWGWSTQGKSTSAKRASEQCMGGSLDDVVDMPRLLADLAVTR